MYKLVCEKANKHTNDNCWDGDISHWQKIFYTALSFKMDSMSADIRNGEDIRSLAKLVKFYNISEKKFSLILS